MYDTSKEGAKKYLEHAKSVLGIKVFSAIMRAPKSAVAAEMAEKYGVKVTTVLEIWSACDDIKFGNSPPPKTPTP